MPTLEAARQALAVAQNVSEYAAGMRYALLGTVHGSGLVEQAEAPRPYFERALALLRDGDPFAYGVALRRFGAYLVHSGDPFGADFAAGSEIGLRAAPGAGTGSPA